MSVMLITHDLGVVAEVADEVAVMYLGRVVERGPVDAIFYTPQHPTRSPCNAPFRNSVRAAPRGSASTAIPGMVPHPLARPTGCRFRTRCPEAVPGLCDRIEPEERAVGANHVAACHLRGAERAA